MQTEHHKEIEKLISKQTDERIAVNDELEGHLRSMASNKIRELSERLIRYSLQKKKLLHQENHAQVRLMVDGEVRTGFVMEESRGVEKHIIICNQFNHCEMCRSYHRQQLSYIEFGTMDLSEPKSMKIRRCETTRMQICPDCMKILIEQLSEREVERAIQEQSKKSEEEREIRKRSRANEDTPEEGKKKTKDC